MAGTVPAMVGKPAEHGARGAAAPRLRTRALALVSATTIVAAIGACRDEKPVQQPRPTPALTSVPTPAQPALAPAHGWPCATEVDLQCTFAHCISGRCGGCTTEAECKPGARCTPTVFGMACLFVAGGAPAPAPP